MRRRPASSSCCTASPIRPTACGTSRSAIATHGWLALGIRLPAHGTVPAALAKVDWQDWMTATRLAVREARRRAGPGVPFHLVGYSNGGALAVKYALDALEDPALAMPDRIVLLSPMIGVTAFARFAGVLGWPAGHTQVREDRLARHRAGIQPVQVQLVPGQRRAAVIAALARAAVAAARRRNEGRLAGLPPIITFQSVVDATVSVEAVVAALYAHLPANGSELVLFDINRQAKFVLVVRPESVAALARLLPAGVAPVPDDRDHQRRRGHGRTSSSVSPSRAKSPRARARSVSPIRPGSSRSRTSRCRFRSTTGCTASQPDPADDFGIRLGALAVRGERGVLITSQESLTRLQSNPFFPYLLRRIDEGLGAAAAEPER